MPTQVWTHCRSGLRAGLTVLGALGAAGCAVNPATGARQLMLISESQ